MSSWLKLSHHQHTGSLRPHEHTSYLPLAVLLAVVGFVLTVASVNAAPPGPAEGSIGITGTVPAGPAPDVAATIKKPNNGQRFGTSPITVEGTCLPETLVEIFKNKIFAGSTPCTDSGTYSLKIDLLFGKNVLIARVFDSLNQAGPDSVPTTVYYDALPAQPGPLSTFDFGGAQLLLSSDAVFRGSFPGQEMNVPLDILGGAPPYAVNIEWGDSNNKVISRPNGQTFRTAHTYQKPGTYQITIQATDVAGRVAFLTVAAVINGQPSNTTGTTAGPTSPPTNWIMALWPLYTAIVGIVISFWLGERREKHILATHAIPTSSL